MSDQLEPLYPDTEYLLGYADAIIPHGNPHVLALSVLAEEFHAEALAEVVLENPKFPLWPGSSLSTQHHYRQGGLAEHTREVVELSLQANKFFPEKKQANPRLLFLACLFHDAGKMWDYAPTNMELTEWCGTPHKRNIHHVTRSVLVWNEACRDYPCSIEAGQCDEVIHAIESHHGLREWGSPVGPNSRIAWLLHLNDSISARMDDNGKAYSHHKK